MEFFHLIDLRHSIYSFHTHFLKRHIYPFIEIYFIVYFLLIHHILRSRTASTNICIETNQIFIILHMGQWARSDISPFDYVNFQSFCKKISLKVSNIQVRNEKYNSLFSVSTEVKLKKNDFIFSNYVHQVVISIQKI